MFPNQEQTSNNNPLTYKLFLLRSQSFFGFFSKLKYLSSPLQINNFHIRYQHLCCKLFPFKENSCVIRARHNKKNAVGLQQAKQMF